VPLTLGVLLKGVRDRNGFVAQVLPIHSLDGSVRRVETGVVDECKSLRIACFWVSLNFGRGQDHPEGRECVVEKFFVHFWIEIADEDVCSHVEVLLVSGRLVDTDRLPVHLDHVHDFDGVVSVLFSQELHETVALVHEGDPVLGHVNIDHRSGLNEKLPYQGLIHFLVKTTNVDGSVLIPLRYRSRRHAGLYT